MARDGVPEQEAAAESDRARNVLRTIQAQDLFAGEREVVIVHNGEAYRLRVTGKGKLILTK